ncbi:MAG: hypothetical protein KIT84_35160 [Labilithrix sp.]|nr:hypothetical protein [Labilithrix sp.]MCW5816290.1 hypothetical protein [Labilithrix sp.]
MLADPLALWAKLDAERALHPADRAVLDKTEPARSLVAELLPNGHARDLWSACALLGRMMADEGASPSLAAATIDNAATALAPVDAARVAAARASLLEGYVAAAREHELHASLAAWEYPRCVVTIEEGVVAVACGRSADDADGLAAWAERVARALTKAKVKRAILAGDDRAKSELASALELVGIALGPAPKRWLPWRR